METPRTGPAGETTDTPRYRALGSTSRVAILRQIRTSPAGLTTNEVADATGLHMSTVRAHLDRLTEAGLLLRERDGGGTPGRPAWRYRAAAADPAPGPYRALAAALLNHVAAETDEEPRTAGARAGLGWGRTLAASADPAALPVDTLLQVLTGLGFDPALYLGDQDPDAGRRPAGTVDPTDTEVHLHACPFLELVTGNPETMCGVHLGVIHGVLETTGAAGARATLEPFGAPDACVIRLLGVPDSAAGNRATGGRHTTADNRRAATGNRRDATARPGRGPR